MSTSPHAKKAIDYGFPDPDFATIAAARLASNEVSLSTDFQMDSCRDFITSIAAIIREEKQREDVENERAQIVQFYAVALKTLPADDMERLHEKLIAEGVEIPTALEMAKFF